MTTLPINIIQKQLDNYQLFLQKREAEVRQGKNNYSLISAFLSIHDETRLHSRFIHSMINPNGTHFQETLYLKEFLLAINPKLLSQFNLDNISVHREKDSIDLLIEDGTTYLILENKLYATDQKKQIERYIESIQQRIIQNEETDGSNIIVAYLSLKGKHPSTYSLGDYQLSEDRSQLIKNKHLIDYYAISYQDTISQWVEACLAQTYNIANLTNAFNEYKIILNRLNKMTTQQQITSFSDFILSKTSSDITELLQFSAMISQNINKIWANHIVNTIYSIPDFHELLIEDPSAKEITPSSLELWLQKPKGKDYKNISLSFYNRAKTRKNTISLGVIALYIGEDMPSLQEESPQDYRKRAALFGIGKNFRKIIQNPSLAGDVCNRIKTRIEQLLAQP
ncbi:PD-(D/E)XK nuclease family protein [Ignatzschineria larvae DSM 13226]|uniref:PD-(D/E)XK nuclease family protein n=1 Tax=Ignatzschineria larvae DSM 13226 TaxID=1111732 RepID=A0ABZ3C3H3_9GAMM|nr:PD-(D/E)XK nuclease family protein [Ignatzschineria larvae]